MKKVFNLLIFSICWVTSNAQFKYYEQGIDAYHSKDYPKTIKSLNAYLDYAIRDKAFDVEVHYCLALSYFKTQSFTSSVREFDRALELGHKNTGNIHWFMAKGYGELKAYKESDEEFAKALEILKEPRDQSKIHYDRALQHEKYAQKEIVIDDLTKAVALNSGNAEAIMMLDRLQEPPAGGPRDMAKVKKEEQTASIKDKPRNNKKDDKSGAVTKPPIIASTEVIKKDGPKKETNQAVVTTGSQNQVKKEELPAEQAVKKEILVATPVVEVKPPTLAEEFKNEKRYALVIGNAKYKSVPPLKNATNDANDIAIELEKSNFEVIKVIDGDYPKMREAFTKFHQKLSNGPKDQTIGLFYYAGHGLQNEGENYLVPIEANVKYDDDIPRMCLPMHRVVLANMERSSTRMNIVIMDACRNNPFPSSSRDVGGGGLAEIKRAKGSFIAYATSPGATASDGEGRNGLYTQELLKAMKKPGRTIEQVFKEVRQNVLKLSEDKQNTWDSSNIIGEFYFKF
jgi:tetratricopeptide (TPR) repeat protein